ncbi:MAG: hypothetical protein JW709_14450 [Sedimentisphaerales bacterium]|nr:hypothetical protein [Sedimentisphaerales bacterium]
MKNLTNTECCNNWICDDEDEYIPFSYASNSCYRNHSRYTLCGIHFAEGHKGSWQDCALCRESIEPEMYVWYGTNEYNFEKLTNPPAYEPTLCHQCGRVIVLSEESYTLKGGHHYCDSCSGVDFDDVLEKLGADEEAEQPLRIWRGESEGDELDDWANEVDDLYLGLFYDLVMSTDSFCDIHLNDEYKELCREMAVSVCQEGSPVLRGRPESWAAGVVYTLGQINFLTDPDQTPHMTAKQIAAGFGVSVATMQAKAKVIREGLDLMPFDPEWTLPSMMGENPLVWMVEVNGFLLDIRTAPREKQIAAFEEGLIPYIPADRDKP